MNCYNQLMNEISEHNQQLLNRLRDLNLPDGKYIVFGSGAMMIRGLKDGHDLDVFVSKDLYEEYKNKEGWKIKPCNSDFYLSNNGVELWETWRPGGWDFDELVKKAEYIDGIPFVPLEITKEWKLLNGRDKDLEHVKIIDEFLNTQS